MSEIPFITVIVPALNAETTLRDCLIALYAQEGLHDYEVIVVDDGSTDATASIAAEFPCQLLRNPQNLGTARSRNTGAQKARGEVLVFIDADVVLKAVALAELADHFENHPEVDAAVGSYTDQAKDANFATTYHNYFTFYHHDMSLDSIEWFWGAIGAVRRWVFEAVGGFDERFHGASAEDMDLGYTLAEAGRKIAYLRTVKGEHLHRFSLWSMLFNDYRKSVLGIKLYLTRKQSGRNEHGFGNPRNAATLIMVYVFAFCLFNLIPGFVGPIPCVLCALVLVGVNWPFYKFIADRSGSGFALGAIGLHWLSFFVIGLGVVMGLLGLSFGRSIFSESPWI